MMLTQFTVRLIVLLIPGLVGTVFFQLFSTKGEIDNRSFATKIILISFISYAIVYVLSYYSPITIECTFFDALLDEKVPVNYSELLLPVILSLVITLIYLYISNYRVMYKLGEKCKLTTKTGENDVWGELFNNSNKGLNGHVYITFVDRKIVYGGFVEYYSMNNEFRELVLQNVKVYKNNKKYKFLYDVDRIYLQLKKNENIIIEIKDKENKDNAR